MTVKRTHFESIKTLRQGFSAEGHKMISDRMSERRMAQESLRHFGTC